MGNLREFFKEPLWDKNRYNSEKVLVAGLRNRSFRECAFNVIRILDTNIVSLLYSYNKTVTASDSFSK